MTSFTKTPCTLGVLSEQDVVNVGNVNRTKLIYETEQKRTMMCTVYMTRIILFHTADLNDLITTILYLFYQLFIGELWCIG